MNKTLQPELATLADPIRREILDMLRVAPRNAGEIAAQFPVSWPAISRHLRLLKQARLIEERRTQRHRIYALRREALLPVLAWLSALVRDQSGALPAPGPDPVRPIVGRQDFMTNPEVVVAGLGAMGSSALYHLASRGVGVVGVDRFQPPHAMGSSHGDSRIIREAYYEHPLYVPLVRRAYQLWDELATKSGNQVYRKTGGLMVGPPDGPLLTGCRASVREHGIHHKLLTAVEVGNRWRGLTPPDGFVGLWEERAGMLLPEPAVAAHLRLAAEAGAEVRTDTMILGWSRSGQDLVVATDQGEIRTRHLVLALGPWISQLLTSQAPVFTVERQQFHWFEPVSGYGDLGPDAYPVALWEHWPGGLFVTLPDTGKGVKIDIHHEGETANPDTVSRVTTPAEEAAVRGLLAKFFPAANGQLRGSTVCLYTNTPDRHFVIDWLPTDPGVLVLSPCSGHGFKFSSVVGEVAADLVLRGTSRFDLTPFSLNRF